MLDLAARLRRTLRGESIPKIGVTPVTGVTRPSGYVPKSLKLRRLRLLRVENTKLENDVIRGVTAHVTSLPDPTEVEIEERKGMAAGSVPELYLDTWAQLQCQKPIRVSDAEWRLAINDAGRFLEAWGALALEFQWKPGDLFDVPRDGERGALVWFLRGETVRALGPEHATTDGGRDFLKEVQGGYRLRPC